MDTVLPGEIPWIYSPYSGEIEGDKLYGRGASDMKSGLSAMFLAVETLFNDKSNWRKISFFLQRLEKRWTAVVLGNICKMKV